MQKQSTQFSEAREMILSELPRIPSRDLSRLVPEVAKASARSFGEITGQAVRRLAGAYIRHIYTDYDKMLNKQNHYYDGVRADARTIVQPAISEMLHKWEGGAI